MHKAELEFDDYANITRVSRKSKQQVRIRQIKALTERLNYTHDLAPE